MKADGFFSLGQRLRSVQHAGRGLLTLVATEPNARIHLVLSVAVAGLGAVVGLSRSDWRWLVAAMVAVWLAEAFNTALERLCDRVSPQWHPLIKEAKDVAAAAVLLASLGAAAVGGLTFWPYLVTGG